MLCACVRASAPHHSAFHLGVFPTFWVRKWYWIKVEIKSEPCCCCYRSGPHKTFTNSFAVHRWSQCVFVCVCLWVVWWLKLENLHLNVRNVWIHLDINTRDPSFIHSLIHSPPVYGLVDISSNCWWCVHLFCRPAFFRNMYRIGEITHNKLTPDSGNEC